MKKELVENVVSFAFGNVSFQPPSHKHSSLMLKSKMADELAENEIFTALYTRDYDGMRKSLKRE